MACWDLFRAERGKFAPQCHLLNFKSKRLHRQKNLVVSILADVPEGPFPPVEKFIPISAKRLRDVVFLITKGLVKLTILAPA